MCKPVIARRPIRWGGCFHFCDFKPSFDNLCMFHLRNADVGNALLRLDITRNINHAIPEEAYHQKRPDLEYVNGNFVSTHSMPIRDDWDFSEYIREHLANVVKNKDGLFVPMKDVRSPELFTVPQRFRLAL